MLYDIMSGSRWKALETIPSYSTGSSVQKDEIFTVLSNSIVITKIQLDNGKIFKIKIKNGNAKQVETRKEPFYRLSYLGTFIKEKGNHNSEYDRIYKTAKSAINTLSDKVDIQNYGLSETIDGVTKHIDIEWWVKRVLLFRQHSPWLSGALFDKEVKYGLISPVSPNTFSGYDYGYWISTVKKLGTIPKNIVTVAPKMKWITTGNIHKDHGHNGCLLFKDKLLMTKYRLALPEAIMVEF